MWREEGKKPIGQYLFYAFGISWCSIALVVLVERLHLFTGMAEKGGVMMIIGFGAGMAPLYATYIILKKYSQITGVKEFIKRILRCDNKKVAAVALIGCMAYQLLKCILTEEYEGYPWYFFILLLFVMIIGGGLEEVGWRGFLQPALEEKLGFIPATLVMGVIWAVWHAPLWLVNNANQKGFNFLSFATYCVVFSFTLAMLYRVSKSVLCVILLHAWGNVVLGGMYSFGALINLPGKSHWILFGIEVVAATAIVFLIDRKSLSNNRNFHSSFGTNSIIHS